MKIDHKIEKINFKIGNLLQKFNIISKIKILISLLKYLPWKLYIIKKNLNKLIIQVD